MLPNFLIALLGVAAAQASPGPNMFAVIAVALGRGRRSALLVVAGIASGTLVWAALTALGLGALFTAVPALLTLLKFVGGAYLCVMGYRGLSAAWRGKATALQRDTSSLSDLAAWRRGFFVVMTNPKALLMWMAIATFLFGAGLGGGEVLLFGPLVALSATLIYGTYGVLFSSGPVSRGYARFWRWIEAAFGTAFGALGLTLIISGLRDLWP
jgi:threonine/homoserine/homoserine lactone efflux protein